MVRFGVRVGGSAHILKIGFGQRRFVRRERSCSGCAAAGEEKSGRARQRDDNEESAELDTPNHERGSYSHLFTRPQVFSSFAAADYHRSHFFLPRLARRNLHAKIATCSPNSTSNSRARSMR